MKLRNYVRDMMHDRRGPPLRCVAGPVRRIRPTTDTLVAQREDSAIVIPTGHKQTAVTMHLIVT
jgi:hypothetical protein